MTYGGSPIMTYGGSEEDKEDESMLDSVGNTVLGGLETIGGGFCGPDGEVNWGAVTLALIVVGLLAYMVWTSYNKTEGFYMDLDKKESMKHRPEDYLEYMRGNPEDYANRL